MTNENNLNRFIEVQDKDYDTALSEIKRGKKISHWMWYIFPQFRGLGYSDLSKRYAISNTDEAEEYLKHPVLGSRLVEISNELLKLKGNDANEIFGSSDDLKLQSSMTLFSSLQNTDPVFNSVLDKFFKGKKDVKTLNLVSENQNI